MGENVFSDFLRAIAPYVVVCGSYGRNEESDRSDIDCFLRFRPREEVDCEIGNESYMPEILDIIKRFGFFSDSCIVGHIAVERQCDVPRMVEISEHYQIPYTETLFVREIYGVPMICARDDKSADAEGLYDVPVWSDVAQDMSIAHPLPEYQAFVQKEK